MTITAKELLELAKKADQGVWSCAGHLGWDGVESDSAPMEWIVAPNDTYQSSKTDDAKYIAAACPHNLIPMLERMVELEALAENMGQALATKPWDSAYSAWLNFKHKR